ncbi:MAG: Wzz/FepE/Etk N-terminal domain-containing protein [Caldilineaceae bacterium]
MELRSYFDVLRRRFWLILIAVLLAVLAAVVLNNLEAPSYTSSVTVRIATVGSGPTGERSDINLSDRVMNTYARVVTGNSVRNQIVQELGLVERPGITAETIPGTELLRIQATASTAQAAHDIAATAASILIDQSRELYGGSGRSTQDILAAQIDQVEQELSTARNEYEQLLAIGNTNADQLAAASQLIELKERTYTTLLDQYERLRLNDALLANSFQL